MTRNVFRLMLVIAILGLIFAFSQERIVGGRIKTTEPQWDRKDNIIMVSVPGLSWERFIQLYELQGTTTLLVDSGMVGLMNTNSAYRRQIEHGYVTMNSGFPAEASREIRFYDRDAILPYGKQALEVYRRYNNKEPLGDYFILNPRHLHDINSSGMSESRVGALGEELKDHGVSRFVYGNSDVYLGEQGRFAALMLIDKGGSVSSAFVEATIDSDSPTIFRTDSQGIMDRMAEQGKGVHLIEYGDFVRLEAIYGSIPLSVYQNWEREVLLGLDSLLEGVSMSMTPTDILILFNPGLIGNEFNQAKWLTPLLVYDGKNSGFLSSGATKRLGLVTNLDVSKSILALMGIKGQGLGQPFIREGQADVYLLDQLYFETRQNHLRRTPLIQGYVTMLILVMIVLVLVMLKKHSLMVLTPYALYVLLLVPLAYLLLPLLGVTGLWESILVTILLTLGLVALISFSVDGDYLKGIIVIAGLTLLVILLDLLTGAHLIITSPLGYSALGGARYYGIGNEYMGFLVGALLILACGILQSHRRLNPLLVLFGVGGVMLIGLPGLGANFGGLLTVSVAFGYAILSLHYTGTVFKKWLLIGGLAFIFLGVIVAVDVFMVQGSHIGQAFYTIKEGGMKALGEIIYRKASLNWKLIKYTVWTRVLLTSVFIVALLVFLPSGIFRRIMEKKPVMATGIAAGVIGALVALVVNDSGVVAAATAMIYPTSVLILLVSEEIIQDKRERVV